MVSVWIKNTAGEKFTFAEGMVDNVSAVISSDLDENNMPNSGPMTNQAYDFNGTGKIITIKGVLFDTEGSSVTDSEDIQDHKVMKIWLEALQDGNQSPVEFYAPLEEKSLQSSSGVTEFTDAYTGAVDIQGTWVTTKVVVRNINFDEKAGNPEGIPFSMNLFIAGTGPS